MSDPTCQLNFGGSDEVCSFSMSPGTQGSDNPAYREKFPRFVCVVIAVLFLAASFFVKSRLPAAVDVAREYCSTQGFPEQRLALLEYHGSDRLVASHQTVRFQMKYAEPAKRLGVDLYRPVYFLPWQISELREK